MRETRNILWETGGAFGVHRFGVKVKGALQMCGFIKLEEDTTRSGRGLYMDGK